MKKEFMKFSASICAVTMLLTPFMALNYASAEEAEVISATPELVSGASDEEELEDVVELLEVVTTNEEEALELENITDEELLEAEPSELPIVEEDPELLQRLSGRMLLDVDGNGEVYYVDPVTGGKEYLADGESAQLLLRRRALGINEENFAKLTLGEEKDEASVCEESELGLRLKGRIVLRTEENGEAYWIYPENCRAYYAGTFEASYELMKKFSLGIAKRNLAKIRNNNRQKLKNAFRVSVYAHAEDENMTLAEARKDLKDEVESIRTCMDDFRATSEERPTREENKERVLTCVQNSGMPRISQERRDEIRETIKETREERRASILNGVKKNLADFNMKKVFERAKQIIQKRRANNFQNLPLE